MKQQIIESVNVKFAQAALAAAAPFYAAARSLAARAVARSWSVFGPAARYNFGNLEYAYAYAASLKP